MIQIHMGNNASSADLDIMGNDRVFYICAVANHSAMIDPTGVHSTGPAQFCIGHDHVFPCKECIAVDPLRNQCCQFPGGSKVDKFCRRKAKQL